MNTINVNGKTYSFPSGSNVSVINGVVHVNGSAFWDGSKESEVKVVIKGDVGVLEVHGDVEVNGKVTGSIQAGGSVTCGDVSGGVTAGNNVSAGQVGMGVKAGNNVTCLHVGGSCHAGNNVSKR